MNSKNNDLKKVSNNLAFLILIFPFIFAWVTLWPGYSNKARAISLIWMIFCIYVFLKI